MTFRPSVAGPEPWGSSRPALGRYASASSGRLGAVGEAQGALRAGGRRGSPASRRLTPIIADGVTTCADSGERAAEDAPTSGESLGGGCQLGRPSGPSDGLPLPFLLGVDTSRGRLAVGTIDDKPADEEKSDPKDQKRDGKKRVRAVGLSPHPRPPARPGRSGCRGRRCCCCATRA